MRLSKECVLTGTEQDKFHQKNIWVWDSEETTLVIPVRQQGLHLQHWKWYQERDQRETEERIDCLLMIIPPK